MGDLQGPCPPGICPSTESTKVCLQICMQELGKGELFWVKPVKKLDPVGSTVRYEMMKLCTGTVKDTMRQ